GRRADSRRPARAGRHLESIVPCKTRAARTEARSRTPSPWEGTPLGARAEIDSTLLTDPVAHQDSRGVKPDSSGASHSTGIHARTEVRGTRLLPYLRVMITSAGLPWRIEPGGAGPAATV